MNDTAASIKNESQAIEILGIALGTLSLYLAYRRYRLNKKAAEIQK
jgi:hypothetical protein